MKLSRWVFLVCGLLSVVLVVPVRSATDLVNGDFSLGTAPDEIDGWVRDATKAQAYLDYVTFRSALRSLTSGENREMSYSQCVDTSGIVGAIDVGGFIWTNNIAAGNIEITLYSDSVCGTELQGPVMLAPTVGSEWRPLSTQINLPGTGTSVKVTLNIVKLGPQLDPTYFDDISVEESDATGVLVVQPSGRAPTGLIAVAALMGIGAMIAFLRRH